MKLSDGIEWGVHCAVVLAALPPKATLPGKALAEFHGVSESYLLKHLKAMAAAGILDSVPGPKGGYRLAKAPQDITVLAIVEAIEGTQSAFRCTEIRQRGPAGLDPCTYKAPCLINATMLQAEAAWKQVLGSQNIAMLAGLVAKTTAPEAIEKAMAWFQANVRAVTE